MWNLHAVGRSTQERVMREHSRVVHRVSWQGTTQPNVLASGSLDGTVRLWDVRTGASCHVLQPACDGVRDVSFDPHAHGSGGLHGTYMATAFDNGSVHLYDTRALHAPVQQISGAHSGLIMTLQWHPDLPGIVATGGRDKTIKVWELYESSSSSSLRNHSFARDILLSPSSAVEECTVAQPPGPATVFTGASRRNPLVAIQSIFNVGRVAWRPGCPRTYRFFLFASHPKTSYCCRVCYPISLG